ncbi:phosphoribosylanthranilate isomerase [Emticicia sp. BO119]|uniref:phosphoribosylanthranilate isomerase n=1 Tax=Emticicia sp. BO119 TaxID=2757768 RepID=UPI0015F08BCC|nr:phosphoribosylanthranilate isomerase [Emticicia sp. BO119]MBA4851872.1 phosphoribosylanthranilate isomerase [Emticicia sp. BO119]
MKLKVCGMRDAENIKELIELKPDFIGFIFYDKSPRFVGNLLDVELIQSITREVRKVGVFVNSTVDYILQNVKKYNLQYVQLHGNETPDFCKSLRLKGVNIIKAFRLDETFIFSQLNNYKPHVDFFLFDAKGDGYGGNGVTFDWSILKKYDNQKPYFLAGGISLDNLDELATITPKPYAFDVNSKFEVEPGIKDIEKIAELITKMRERKSIQV